MNEVVFRLNRKQSSIVLIAILLISILLRLPGVLWGVDFEESKIERFHPDEKTNIRISQQILGEENQYKVNYPAGYGTLLASFYRVVSPGFSSVCGIPVSGSTKYVFLGRLLSVILGIATVCLLFLISLKIFDNRAAALFGAFFLCVSGLHVTQSHYATADVMLTFLIYLNIYLCLCCLDKRGFFLMFVACLVSGFAIGTKASVATFGPLGFVAYLKMRDMNRGSKVVLVSLILFLAGTGILLSNGFYSNIETIKGFYEGVVNDNLFAKEHVKVLNPFFYLFFMIPSMGAVSFVFSLSFIVFLKNKAWLKRRSDAYILVLPVFITLLTISTLSIPFTRHSLPLVPFMCLLAGLGCAFIVQNKISRPVVRFVFIAGIVSYQLLYVYSIEINFIKESRFEAARWFKQNVEFTKTSTYVSPYSYVSIPQGKLTADPEKASFLILSEPYYKRFIRSVINPISSYPECGPKIYHADKESCQFFQTLLKGEGHFDLIKEFKIKSLTPELIVFKKYYGSPARFVGDVKIYRRRESMPDPAVF